MSATHTPGPWSYQPNGYGWNNLCGADGRSIWTASARTDEDAANRALIVAAPELYEYALLQEKRSRAERPAHGCEWCADCCEMLHDKRRAALAKAEGRS